uniref:tlde1 domain-containing protein n=1 Tax=Sinorhizobium chiapasense TaxID=501572 RepID=UPI002FE24044
MRPLLITCCGTALVGAAAWSFVGMVAVGGSFAHGSGRLLPKPQLHLAEKTKERAWDKHARVNQATRLVAAAAAQPFVSATRFASDLEFPRDAELLGKSARLATAVKNAVLASEQLTSTSAPSVSAQSRQVTAMAGVAAPARFAPMTTGFADKPAIQLAYATPSQSHVEGSAFSAVLTAPPEDDLAEQPDPDTADDTAALPSHEDTPSVGPMPQFRPRSEQAEKPAAEPDKPATKQAEVEAVPKAEETGKAGERETPAKPKVAYARPQDPAENSSGTGFGQALRNIFGGGAKAGNGVAVYDITAAKVYMPDGSVLEAHSGIGKMADNPRYVDVKMTGPTPPHTYNLRMRETRFHGVEAIRMLPIDGKNKHGRDGFLTHSYLLRGGRAESHGCVAFADYPRFLTAFKQGKVKQLVVVPSGGRAAGLRLAQNGRSS